MITAASPPTRDYLSYSAVRTFQSCPLKYRFRYLDGLAEECVSSALVFGSAISGIDLLCGSFVAFRASDEWQITHAAS